MDRGEVFHKCFQLLTQLPQLAPSCPVFNLTNMLRMLQFGQDRWADTVPLRLCFQVYSILIN